MDALKIHDSWQFFHAPTMFPYQWCSFAPVEFPISMLATSSVTGLLCFCGKKYVMVIWKKAAHTQTAGDVFVMASCNITTFLEIPKGNTLDVCRWWLVQVPTLLVPAYGEPLQKHVHVSTCYSNYRWYKLNSRHLSNKYPLSRYWVDDRTVIWHQISDDRCFFRYIFWMFHEGFPHIFPNISRYLSKCQASVGMRPDKWTGCWEESRSSQLEAPAGNCSK